MAKDNSGFFEHKNDWSRTKDRLLQVYLLPYLTKVLSTGRPILYVDSFAGKGMFDDGEPGSPVIACEVIEQALSLSKSGNRSVHALFVEKEYADELRTNTARFGFADAARGTYEQLSDKLLQVRPNANLFLYVDPFGIKSLDLAFFEDVSKRFSSAEILLNLNSFGFFRAACSAYGVAYDVADEQYLVERDGDCEAIWTGNTDLLDRVAGGDYWRPIVERYKVGTIDGYEAEREFAEDFCGRLSRSYRYVLNMPIRTKKGNRPKYRMIHASNHEAGCLLMYDNMQRRMSDMQEVQRGGQRSLFAEDSDDAIIDVDGIREALLNHINNVTVPTRLEVVLATFVVRYGLTVSMSEFQTMVSGFEREGRASIIRTPERTPSGTSTRFMTSKGAREVRVMGNNG